MFKSLTKEISTPLGIIIIILVTVLAGGTLAWQYFEILKQELKVSKEKFEQVLPEEITGDKTTNWKTYRNEEYGFEVRYPQKWGLEILSDVRHPYIEGIDIIQPYNEVYKPGSYVGKDLTFFVISSSSVNIDNIIKDNKAEEIDLGNVMAWRYERQIEGPETMVLTEQVTLIQAKDFYIEISELKNYGPTDYSYRSRTISTMLSTFRFLE